MKNKNKQKTVVFKFGGSALASKAGQQTLKNEVLNAKRNEAKNLLNSCEKNFYSARFSVFVLSAIGKSPDVLNDEKLTDLLICYDFALKSGEKQKIICAENKIKNKLIAFYKCFYTNEAAQKKSKTAFKKYFARQAALKTNFEISLKDNQNDFLISRGEYFTAKTFCDFFGGSFFDAKNLIFINEKQKPDLIKTKNALTRTLIKNSTKTPFITGFYGNQNGKIKLFKRGGGDFSGAIVSKCLNADLYVNYTDVNGIKNAPPVFIKNAKTFKKISYRNLKTLCSAGANVLSEQSALLICRKKIRTVIKNAFDLSKSPQKTVTAKKQKSVFKAITVKSTNEIACIFLFGKGLKSKKSRKKIKSMLTENKIIANVYYDKKSVRLKTNEANAEKAIKLLYDNFIK